MIPVFQVVFSSYKTGNLGSLIWRTISVPNTSTKLRNQRNQECLMESPKPAFRSACGKIPTHFDEPIFSNGLEKNHPPGIHIVIIYVSPDWYHLHIEYWILICFQICWLFHHLCWSHRMIRMRMPGWKQSTSRCGESKLSTSSLG